MRYACIDLSYMHTQPLSKYAGKRGYKDKASMRYQLALVRLMEGDRFGKGMFSDTCIEVTIKIFINWGLRPSCQMTVNENPG
jgi:hypothetical protein